MSSTTNISFLGDAAPDGIAIWVCGAALILLLGAIITKSEGSADLRFLTCCVLLGIFGILGFAFLSPRHPVSANAPAPPAALNQVQAPTTNPTRLVDEYLGDAPTTSSQNGKLPGLQASSAGSGVSDRSQGR